MHDAVAVPHNFFPPTKKPFMKPWGYNVDRCHVSLVALLWHVHVEGPGFKSQLDPEFFSGSLMTWH